MKLRIATILARHGSDRYPDALADLDRFYRERLPDVIRHTVVVDNALARSTLRVLDRDTTLIGGDNAYWEFSAWDRGVAYLDQMRVAADLIHFVTSAFNALDTKFIDLIDRNLLTEATRARAVVGHVDYFDEPVSIRDFEVRHWVRSSFFFLPPAAVMSLRSMVGLEDAEEIFGHDPEQPFLEGAPLSPRYRRYLVDWLTGEGTGQGVEWHSRIELDRESLPRFVAKATAILNEAILTARLRKLGYPIADLTWLRARLDSEGDIAWSRDLPDQIAERSAPAL